MCQAKIRVLTGLMGMCVPGLLAAADPVPPPAEISIIPKPASLRQTAGSFTVDAATAIGITPVSAEMKRIGSYLADLVAPATGFKLAVGPVPSGEGKSIILKLDDARKDLGEEGYALTSQPEGVVIAAWKPAGVFHGIQTLRQLLPTAIESRQAVKDVTWSVPGVAIEDVPRFRWRGYLIDPARNFRTKEELKRYIDLLALQKMNIMQIHLTDDQGWRIEIKNYPKLVEIGARLPDYTGRKGEGWVYTQEEMRGILQYAAERYVTIVPEIEMPGHSGAALAAYPELACGGNPPGGWSRPLCVSQESTFEFATQVLDEVAALFPSPYIHVGADEVPPDSWRACAKCKPLMEQLAKVPLPGDVPPFRVKVSSGQGLPVHDDICRLQGEFIRKIDRHLASKGRKMVGWDEILDGGLKNGSPAVVMAWRGATAVAGATAHQRDVVITLHPDYYLDNDTSLQRTYEYEPVPADLPKEQEPHVLGVQGNMWGETTSSLEKVDARSFPRLCSIAETGWTPAKAKDFRDFSGRLGSFRQRLEKIGVKCGKF